MNWLQLEEKIGEESSIAILHCPERDDYGREISNPVAYMDNVIEKYVAGDGYNMFVVATLNNPYRRIVIKGINDLDWHEVEEEFPLFIYSSLREENARIRFLLFHTPSEGYFEQMKEIVDKVQNSIPGMVQYRHVQRWNFNDRTVRLLIEDIDVSELKEVSDRQDNKTK